MTSANDNCNFRIHIMVPHFAFMTVFSCSVPGFCNQWNTNSPTLLEECRTNEILRNNASSDDRLPGRISRSREKQGQTTNTKTFHSDKKKSIQRFKIYKEREATKFRQQLSNSTDYEEEIKSQRSRNVTSKYGAGAEQTECNNILTSLSWDGHGLRLTHLAYRLPV